MSTIERIDPQQVIRSLYKATGKKGYYFPYSIRATYENYDAGSWHGDPMFGPWNVELFRITRFVEEAGGEDTNLLLGNLTLNNYFNGQRLDTDHVIFTPNTELSVKDLFQVILDCQKAGIKVNIPDSSELATLIDMAGALTKG